MDDSSDDDDMLYVGAVARLKALKKKNHIIVPDDDSPTSEKDDFRSSKPSVPVIESAIIQNSNNSRQRNRRSNRTRKAASKDVQILSEPVVVIDVDSLDDSQDLTTTVEDDNYNMDVKIKWQSKSIIRLELRRYESFEKIFKYFADLEGVSEKQILIQKGNKIVHKADSPASLGLTVIDFLEGGIVSESVTIDETADDDENVCKIRVQMATKKKINVDLKMDEPFKKVVMTCAEQLGVPPSKIKLSFDGDKIDPSDTPESLDLEQEACIDLCVVK